MFIRFGHLSSKTTFDSILTNFFFKLQVSFADTNPLLSDRSTYPHFFRTVPSDSDFNPARIGLLRHFNWTRVGTLFQDASRGSSRYAYVSFSFASFFGGLICCLKLGYCHVVQHSGVRPVSGNDYGVEPIGHQFRTYILGVPKYRFIAHFLIQFLL